MTSLAPRVSLGDRIRFVPDLSSSARALQNDADETGKGWCFRLLEAKRQRVIALLGLPNHLLLELPALADPNPPVMFSRIELWQSSTGLTQAPRVYDNHLA